MTAPSATDTGDDATDWDVLMRASLAGDRHAYAHLLRALEHWLRGFYRRRLPPALVDDAAQDALIAIHEKRHTYTPGRPLRPWVAAIARYKWIDRLRAMPRQDEPLDDALPGADFEAPLQAALELEALLATLRPAQAEAIRLVKLQGFSVAEASRRTGQSISLVKVNIHRGLAALARVAERSEAAT